MKKLIIPILALAAGFGVYLVVHQLRAPSTAVTTVSEEGPDTSPIAFALPDLEGKSRDIREWRSKVVLINFWATWCPPCREEMPLLMEFQEKYATNGLQIIGVAIDNLHDVIEFRDDLGIKYPLLIGEDDAIELMGRYGNRVGALPYSVILDRDGRIVSTKTGAYSRLELENAILPFIQPPHEISSRR